MRCDLAPPPRRVLRVDRARRRARPGPARARAGAARSPLGGETACAERRPDLLRLRHLELDAGVAGPGSPTRLERALGDRAADAARPPDVPSGVATMTDRVLPNIFPTGTSSSSRAALAETVGVERPPPKGFEDRATTFAALDTLAGDNFFSEGIKHRCRSAPDGRRKRRRTSAGTCASRCARRPARIRDRADGRAGERIWVNGELDRGYRPIAAARATAGLARVVTAARYNAGQVAAATAAAKRFLGTGPLEGVGHGLRAIALAPWLALASLLPLLLLLWSRRIATHDPICDYHDRYVELRQGGWEVDERYEQEIGTGSVRWRDSSASRRGRSATTRSSACSAPMPSGRRAVTASTARRTSSACRR